MNGRDGGGTQLGKLFLRFMHQAFNKQTPLYQGYCTSGGKWVMKQKTGSWYINIIIHWPQMNKF